MKRLGYGILLALSLVVAGYAVFLGVLSILVGLNHQGREGAWVAILAGVLVVLGVLYALYRLCRGLYARLRDQDTIEL